MRRTKIVCTIGPSSSSTEALSRLIDAGMDVARLNFSHGSHEDHANVIANIRSLSKEKGRPIALLQDLSGPKVRVGIVPDDGVHLERGGEVVLTLDPPSGEGCQVHLPVPAIFDAVSSGTRLMLDDGLLELEVITARSRELRCKVIVGGVLKSNKGVNVPGVSLPIAAVTDKDYADLLFGISQGVDWVAASFVRSAEDISALRHYCRAKDSNIPLIAKIEKHEAIDNIDSILEIADAIMVARGDLGVEVPIDEVPVIQKMLIAKANRAGKPVITATQMLDSMIRNPRPTRAEVTDVANAIYDGTDAVMLSGETAMGEFPIEAVSMMDKIARHTESAADYRRLQDNKFHDVAGHHTESNGRSSATTGAIGEATCEIARDLDASAIITATSSGRTAQIVSRYRPHAPIVAATNLATSYNRMALVWGVFPVMVDIVDDADGMMQVCIDAASATGLVKENDRVVLTGGVPVGTTGSTNFIKVHRIGQPLRPL